MYQNPDNYPANGQSPKATTADFNSKIRFIEEQCRLEEEIKNLHRVLDSSLDRLSIHQNNLPNESGSRSLSDAFLARSQQVGIFLRDQTFARQTLKISSWVPAIFRGKYQYLRGRERLGQMRSPAGAAMLVVLTLGAFWLTWHKKTFRDLLWHGFKRFDYNHFIPSLAGSMVYGFHFFYIFKLAKLLSFIENQNGYRRTSPRFATAIAVLPPFAVWYLQSNLNYHWKQHVLHQG